MTTTHQLSQPVTSLPPKQQQLPKISLKTKEKLCVLGVLAGTVFAAISQQAALTSIPLLGLLLIQRTNQHRLTLDQQQQQQIIAVVERSLSSLSTQIQQLETQIDEIESFSKNTTTKTKLVLIDTKLSQLQQENRIFKFKQLRDLTQKTNDLQQQLDDLTNQTENLHASQQKLDQKLQQLSSQSKPSPNPSFCQIILKKLASLLSS